MPSQFFGLNIAYTGLLASNAALNATSNNIANVQTDGYSRQKVNQQAASALRVFQTYGAAGAGVETLAIERIRDEFYDGRYWDNNSRVGEYAQKQYYMQQVENYFDDNGKNAGFKTVFDKLMATGLQELMKDPHSDTAKAQFVGSAGDLVEYFNGVAGNMLKLQKDINQEIKLKVDEINSLAGEIATLNKQINTIELTGIKANELRDRRELLIDQLSEIVDVDVKEIPVTDPINPDRETGANRLLIKVAGGQLLIDDSDFNGLKCVAREIYERVNQTDIDGLYDVYWENGQRFSLYNPAMGGALKGLVEMRDGNNGENFRGLITATGDVVTPEGVCDTVTIQVDRPYLQDLNKCNLSHTGGKINLGSQEFYYKSWSYEISFDDKGNEVYSYTFVLSENRELNPTRLTNDRVGKDAFIGATLSYQGVPYYMNQMNEWVRTFSEKFNDILLSGYDSAGERGIKMFTGDMAASENQFELTAEYRSDLFLKGRKLLGEVYERALENMVLEADAKQIYDAKIASAQYTTDVDALKAAKQTTRENAALDKLVSEKMAEPAVQAEVTARAAALKAATPTLSDAEARKQAAAEIESEYRNGTNGKTAVALTTAEKNEIAAKAEEDAKKETEARYRKEALKEAKEKIQNSGNWDTAIKAARQKLLAKTAEGEAALEQAKQEIASENGFLKDFLDVMDTLLDDRRKEIKDEAAASGNPVPSEEDVWEQAYNSLSFTVNVADDSYYRVTAENFSILDAMDLDPSRLSNRYDNGDGVEQNDLLEDIRDLATNKEKMSFRSASASEFLQCVLSDVALNAQRANTFYKSYKDVAGTIDMQRISISGVDEDEEALNLVKYQNGYNLASKMIQTLTEIYDRLILETGV